jgi:hypothetical protein
MVYKDSLWVIVHIRNYKVNDTIELSIRKIKGRDTVFVNEQQFPVKRIPDPVVGIGGKPIVDKISKTDILKYKGLTT